MSDPPTLDQVARDAAAQALAAINTHTQVCVERQKHIDALLSAAADQRKLLGENLDRMRNETRDSIRGLYRQQWVALGTMVMVLLSICVGLVAQLWLMR